MARFYRDRGIPEVERLARAYCRYWGSDPDEQVQETGYDETTVPLWWKHQDQAAAFIAMMACYNAPGPEPVVPAQPLPLAKEA